MKKNTLSILALILSLCALLFSLITIGQLKSRIETLESYTASMAAQVQQLSGRNDSFFSTSDDALFSSLMVESWSHTSGNLTITAGLAQVLLPQVAASTPDSSLTLKLNGEDLGTQSLELFPDATGAAFDGDLHGISFELPDLTEEDLLELWLEVTVSGRSYRILGAEWFLENGQLLMVAG
ncbi:MAG: hypothetical protein J6B95_06470 [Oscillospiraceae bacterium]|nr:hypothetical protein [Oscillospiraceae bacterium]